MKTLGRIRPRVSEAGSAASGKPVLPTRLCVATGGSRPFLRGDCGRQTIFQAAAYPITLRPWAWFRYLYDADGLKTQMIDPQGHSATYHYDADLRMDYTIDRDGRRRDFTYRDDGLLLTDTWRNSLNVVVDTLTFTYDADGNRLSAANTYSTTSGVGAYTFSYDPDNRLTYLQEPFGLALTYGYDQEGRISSVRDSKYGVLTSVYDAGNRLTNRQFSVTQGPATPPVSVKVEWTPRNEVSTVTYYSDANYSVVAGKTLHDVYDDAVPGQIVHMQHQNSTAVVRANYTYSYDQAERLGSQTLDGTSTAYTYDAADRLTNESGGTTASYHYDAAGNRNATDGFTPTYSNQLQQDNLGNTYTYDAEGNELTKSFSGGNWTYQYDNANHLTTAQHYTGGMLDKEIDYHYDAMGNRIERDQAIGGTGNPVERYGYDRGNIWADLDNNGNVLARRFYLDGVDQIFARDLNPGAQATLTYYLTDRQGSVRKLMDTSGNIVNTVTYPDAYGATPTDSTPAQADRYKFTGREFDQDTGLQHNGPREYDPKIEKWLSQDPAEFTAGDSNLYRYVGDGPTNATDPTGLQLVAAAGSEDKWLQELSDMGLTAYAGSLPNRWFRSSRVAIYVPYSDQPKVRELLQKADNDWQRNLMHALLGDFQYNLEGNGQLGIGETTLSAEEQDKILEWKARWEDAAKYSEHAAESGALVQLAGAALQGANDGSAIVLNELTFRGFSSLDAHAQRLIAENGDLYKGSSVAGQIAREALVSAATAGATRGLVWVGRQGAGLLAARGVALSQAAASRLSTAVQLGKLGVISTQTLQIAGKLDKALVAARQGNISEVLQLGLAGIDVLGLASSLKDTLKAGTFSVRDWSGYPSGVARPKGPFRLLEGAEYDAARKAANEANAALRRADPAKYAGKQIHEIQPVKFGGSPTDPANKIALTPQEHQRYTTFWYRLQRQLEP